jgi:hypothetical protein
MARAGGTLPSGRDGAGIACRRLAAQRPHLADARDPPFRRGPRRALHDRAPRAEAARRGGGSLSRAGPRRARVEARARRPHPKPRGGTAARPTRRLPRPCAREDRHRPGTWSPRPLAPRPRAPDLLWPARGKAAHARPLRGMAPCRAHVLQNPTTRAILPSPAKSKTLSPRPRAAPSGPRASQATMAVP